MNMSRRRKASHENRIDYGLILTVFLLAIIGILSVYATTVLVEGNDLRPTLFHALWYGIGAIAVIVVMQFNSEQYWKMADYLYGGGLLLLVLVLIFYDRSLATSTGARSWFTIGPFSMQPSEFFKPAYIIFLSKLVTTHNNQNQNRTIKSDWILLGKIALAALPPVILIQLQNDLGTNLVILSITAGVVVISGISWKILAPMIIGVVLFAGLFIYLISFNAELVVNSGILAQYQVDRILDWLNPFANAQGSGYQLAQSIKAIGSGQLSGKGFGVSEVTVPVRESDFIFTTIAENGGFIAAALLLFIYFVLIYQMVQTCFETKNEFYTYIAVGVISMVMFHIFENVGMTIGLTPITGVPLPFISQGGSALLSNMIGIGLILSMRYHYRSYRYADAEDFLY
ncbi:rod shape-determining protein RodA [Suicoccus acidiformans]|uniref:Rod shape-determining protein RodA n=1 Tax=Suicoccus acidiformans TaxID=2036206 RepID=A0A347WKN3_9LACT|nr:FtsW/RodA/SpoVE family cell cycle protein [Suicoccus acidiformans]AXY25640.1 rod shape-determining protein RodA [Suicoccus acidiformans]